MTEAEWLSCTAPRPMLRFLRGQLSDRKLRLFAVACCRLVWHLMTEEPSRRAVEAAERLADGQTSQEGLATAYRLASAASDLPREPRPPALEHAAGFASSAALFAAATDAAFPYREEGAHWDEDNGLWSCARDAADCAARAAAWAGRAGADFTATLDSASHVLRDLVGNPFRLMHLQPEWRTTDVQGLAQAVYEERAFDRLPVLGDALEEAGCDGAVILSHCREAGAHVRGCWVVDLLLGKK
jgi:hypothetical protein